MLLKSTAVWPKVTIATAAETGFPQLVWEPVEGASGYEIWRAASKDGTFRHMWTTDHTYYTNTSAVAGRTYYYKVQPLGVDVTCSDAAYITCDCAQPQVSALIHSASGLPVLTWEAVPGASQYEVWRATSADGAYSKMWTADDTTYCNTTARCGRTYYYKVKALCTTSRYGDSALSEAVYVTCDCAVPVVHADSCRLSWDAVSGAGRYEIYRSAHEDGTFMPISTVSETSYSAPATAGTTWYKVRALCSVSSYGDGALSEAVSVEN